MKTLQHPISEDHHNAMFFDGVVAEGTKEGKTYQLGTFQNGEITYDDDTYAGEEIIKLGKEGDIADPDIDEALEEKSWCVSILVDKFFAIYHNGELVDEENLVCDGDYDDAIEWFEEFLSS